MSVKDEGTFEYAFRGNAWKVYWLLLKSGRPMSVREVQKALHFSSPSVASHHLEQLRELGLVQKQEVGGNYCLVSEIRIGVLRHFVKLGKLLLRTFLHNPIFGLSPNFYAWLYTGEPFHYSIWSYSLGNLLVRNNSHMVSEAVLISGHAVPELSII